MILIYLEDPAKALGLEEGDAHVIRSAGGRAVDAIRSLVISQLFFFFFGSQTGLTYNTSYFLI